MENSKELKKLIIKVLSDSDKSQKLDLLELLTELDIKEIDGKNKTKLNDNEFNYRQEFLSFILDDLDVSKIQDMLHYINVQIKYSVENNDYKKIIKLGQIGNKLKKEDSKAKEYLFNNKYLFGEANVFDVKLADIKPITIEEFINLLKKD